MTTTVSRALSPSSRIAISEIDHTGITVSSLDEALSFWVDALGFEHLYTWDLENSSFLEELLGVKGVAIRLAMIEGPGHLIELLEYRSPDDRQVLKPRSCDVGSVHVGFFVEDIDALVARIATMGWNPLGQVQTIEAGERAGLRLVYVRGPDGMTLEFLQRPKRSNAAGGELNVNRSHTTRSGRHDPKPDCHRPGRRRVRNGRVRAVDDGAPESGMHRNTN